MRALTAITLSLPLVLSLLLEPATDLEPVRTIDPGIKRVVEIGQERRRIATAVLEARMTLAQAAAGFKELSDQQPPEYLECMRCNTFPLACRDELHFRHVLGYAETQSAASLDEKKKSAVERLRQEMQQREQKNCWQ